MQAPTLAIMAQCPPAMSPVRLCPIYDTLAGSWYVQCAPCPTAGDSERLITASTDSTAKLWDVMSGQCLFTWKFSPPCKAVAFSLGTKLAAVSTDPFREQKPQIHLVSIADDVRDQTGDVALHFEGFDKRINRLVFTDLNRTLLSAGEDGYVRRWDVEVWVWGGLGTKLFHMPNSHCF